MQVHVIAGQAHWQDFINDQNIGHDQSITIMTVEKAKELSDSLDAAIEYAEENAPDGLVALVSK